MNRDDATAWLTEWFSATPDAAPLISQALALVADAAGRGPVDAGYIETFDVWLSASAVAEMLALKGAMQPSAGMLKRIQSEGTTLEVEGAQGVSWWALARLLRARSPLMAGYGAGIGAITVDDTTPYYARSGGVL